VQRRRIADIPSERLHTAPVQAHSEMVDSSLANIGSVTLGGQASISIGPLLIALKRLLRGGRGTTISGSVQRYGTRIQIVATVRRRHGTDTVMVERGARGQKQADAAVPAMVRELAYRVHFALAEDRMQAGTWELLESFTEARAALIKYLGSGKPEHSQRALELTRRTYEMDCTYPRLFGLFYCLGTSYFGSGEYEKAIQQLEIALTIHPRQPAGFVQLARCYCAMADDDRALALLERVRGRPPDGHPMAQYMLGLILGAAGEPERAIDELLRVERRPRSLRSSAWVTIAGLCSQLDDMRTYRGALGRVAERDFDGDWYGRACWLSVRSRRGGETDRETALESLQEALRRRSMPLGYALRDPDLYHIREGATFPGIALRACAPAGQLAGVLEPS